MEEVNIDILELTLPKYLKDDLKALQKGRENQSSLLDCLYNEVQGSINSALYSYEITASEAALLRKKHLGIEP
ncbi:MAG: hypothetical protein ACK5LR_08870 [Mangrovibacterium sp.]